MSHADSLETVRKFADERQADRDGTPGGGIHRLFDEFTEQDRQTGLSRRWIEQQHIIDQLRLLNPDDAIMVPLQRADELGLGVLLRDQVDQLKASSDKSLFLVYAHAFAAAYRGIKAQCLVDRVGQENGAAIHSLLVQLRDLIEAGKGRWNSEPELIVYISGLIKSQLQGRKTTGKVNAFADKLTFNQDFSNVIVEYRYDPNNDTVSPQLALKLQGDKGISEQFTSSVVLGGVVEL